MKQRYFIISCFILMLGFPILGFATEAGTNMKMIGNPQEKKQTLEISLKAFLSLILNQNTELKQQKMGEVIARENLWIGK